MTIISPTIAGSDAAVCPVANPSNARIASCSPSRSRSKPPPRAMIGLTTVGSGGGGKLVGTGLRARPADAAARLSATQPAQTTASGRELLANRLDPGNPGLATSPHAHIPTTELRPTPSTA